MRKSAYSAAAVVSSVALLVVGAPTASQAYTQKELTVCYTNTVPDSTQDIEFVADGPSYRTASMDNGDCEHWDVRPGQYKLTVEDVKELLAGLSANDMCDHYVENGIAKPYVNLNMTIKRQNESYRAFDYAAISNGEVTTNIRKNRSTSVVFNVFCSTAEPTMPADVAPLAP
jgi:hypothetical protein